MENETTIEIQADGYYTEKRVVFKPDEQRVTVECDYKGPWAGHTNRIHFSADQFAQLLRSCVPTEGRDAVGEDPEPDVKCVAIVLYEARAALADLLFRGMPCV